MEKPLLIICGPTATGKTSLGIKLAKMFAGEIISADSRQVYRGMDIITGKDIPVNSKVKSQNSKLQLKSKKYVVGYRLLQNIPVWLTDICLPNQDFNVAHFARFASRVIEEIWQRGKLPILVGGTGLYIKSLLEPIKTAGIAPDWELRIRLASWSVGRLQHKLKRLDSQYFSRMNQSDRNNPRRLIRAIEIARKNQEPRIKDKVYPLLIKDCFIIGLKITDLKRLYDRIDKRVAARVDQGAEKEARMLFGKCSSESSVLTTTIGYKQWLPYLKGEIAKEEVFKRWQFAEHAYARRQMTWFKKQPCIRWFDIRGNLFPQNVVKLVKGWYSGKKS